ncbi:MAG: hypothetical protein ACREFZ_10265, partial [Acetobacteraceae bacterium]
MRVRLSGVLAALALLAPALTACAASPRGAGGTQASVLPATRAAVVAFGPTIVSQVHNASGWQPSRRYRPASGPAARIVNGPGWNPSEARYHPGLPLDAYQLVSTGPCLSAPGGGPQGRGASIRDGTCTWKYLSAVDYISITG